MAKLKKKKTKVVKKREKAGQPTKYKPGYCDEIVEFFNIEPYEDLEIDHFDEDGNVKWTDKKRVATKLPTLVGFSRKIGVCYSTIKNWMDVKHPSHQPIFLATVTRVAKDMQKDHLIQSGLQGLYNPQAFKFVAINITNMRDQSGLALTGPEGEPLEITVTVKNGT